MPFSGVSTVNPDVLSFDRVYLMPFTQKYRIDQLNGSVHTIYFIDNEEWF